MIRTNRLFHLGIMGILAAFFWIPDLRAEPLTVDKVKGQVEFRMRKSQAWQPVAMGMNLDLPSEVRAGQNSGARLSQMGTTFTLKSNTRVTLELPAEEPDGLIKRVKQWIGTVLYRVERRPDEFSVETPFLVSTVKGTEFVVVSSESSSFVTLLEGSLEVEDLSSGQLQLMESGDVVEAGSSEGMRSMETTTSSDSDSAPAGQLSVSGASAMGLPGEEVGSAEEGGFGEELESLREMEADRRAEDFVREGMAPEEDSGAGGGDDEGPMGGDVDEPVDEGPGNDEDPLEGGSGNDEDPVEGGTGGDDSPVDGGLGDDDSDDGDDGDDGD